MLYHICGIDFDYFLFNYSTLFNKNDIIVLDRSVIGRIDYNNLEEAKRQLKELCLFSKNSGTILICGSRVLTKGECYNSAFVIEYGELIGVSSQVSNKKGYNNGKYIDLYSLCFTSILLILEDDCFKPDLTMFSTLSDIRYIVHLSSEKINTNSIKVMSYLSAMSNAKIFDLYNDVAITYDSFGNLQQIEIGNLRRFNTIKSLKHQLYKKSIFRIQKKQ